MWEIIPRKISESLPVRKYVRRLHMSSTALLDSLLDSPKQIFLKPGGKLIVLALTAKSGFCQ
jgi:hypothetical protein